MFDATEKTSPGYYSPAQTALLLLDFHQMFVENIEDAGAREALETAAEMRKWAQSCGIRVIHALIDIEQSPFESCKDAASENFFRDSVQMIIISAPFSARFRNQTALYSH